MTRELRLALAQFPIPMHDRWDAYASDLSGWVAEAAPHADLLVFPEYGGMGMVRLCPPETWTSELGQLPALQDLLPAYLDLHAELARRHGVYLLAGSLPVAEGSIYLNRAYFFGPNGARAHQDKLVLTPSEVASSGLTAGEGARVFDTELGRVAVAICYDSEFPQQARAQAESGAELLLVPTCTSNLRGYHRVRIGSLARALENQCYAALSPLVGTAPWLAGLTAQTGAAGVYTPSDEGLPEDGVLVQGALDAPGWVYAHLDLARLEHIRREGHVRGLRDYPTAARTVGAERVQL